MRDNADESVDKRGSAEARSVEGLKIERGSNGRKRAD